MTTHVLWQADVADFDIWHDVFLKDHRSRHSAGIKDLHVWRDPDNPGRALALFAVHDIDRAHAFFDSEEMAMHIERGGVANITVTRLIEA